MNTKHPSLPCPKLIPVWLKNIATTLPYNITIPHNNTIPYNYVLCLILIILSKKYFYLLLLCEYISISFYYILFLLCFAYHRGLFPIGHLQKTNCVPPYYALRVEFWPPTKNSATNCWLLDDCRSYPGNATLCEPNFGNT